MRWVCKLALWIQQKTVVPPKRVRQDAMRHTVWGRIPNLGRLEQRCKGSLMRWQRPQQSAQASPERGDESKETRGAVEPGLLTLEERALPADPTDLPTRGVARRVASEI